MILTCFLVEWYNRVVEAGAWVLVAGAAIFRKDKSVSETMKELRASFEG
jgi:pentose-5-phosphate-3-epimerase